MKRKVKKYAGGNLVDSSGNPVRSGSGEPVRTRSDDEIAEDSKFGGYGRYMPKLTRSITLGGKSSATEDRPTSSGVDDYETMGKRAGATSPFSGPKEYISESVKEESIKEPEMDTEEPRRKISDYISSSEDKKPVVKKKTVKKAPATQSSQSFPTRDRDRADQSFPLKTDDKKVPPLRKIGEAIMGSVANASKPYSSSMYDKMKGRKAGGSIKMASGGKVSSASSRGDGIAQRGKTKGRIC
jgi:hypothetical protein